MANSNFRKILESASNSIIIGIAVSILIPVIAWFLIIVMQNVAITPSGILQMHLKNPVLWLTELVPLLTVIVFYYFNLRRIKENEKFEEEIRTREELREKHAYLAKKIGEGNYDIDFTLESEDDSLGKSLLVMKNNLLTNSKKEVDQSWIAEGKETVANILRMHNKLDELSYDVIVKLIKYINVIQGALYLYNEEEQTLVNIATYAYNRKKYINQTFKIGEGLIGQCAYEMDIIYLTEIPDDYATITSGIIGEKKPSSILIVPLISDEKLQGVLEFASLEAEIPKLTIKFLKELGEIISRTLFNLRINQKTEKLLGESQQMTLELRENEEQLRQNAEEMRATQEELEKSNIKLEAQVHEVENAQKRLFSLLENASEIISIYNKDFQLAYISPSVIKILGYTPEEMMNGKDTDRLTRKGETDLKNMLKQLLTDPTQSQTIQYTYIKKDGEKIFLEATGRNLLKDKAINGIIINSQDITERKRAEKEERMKSKMQALSENSLDMILRLNTFGTFFYANPVIEDYIGLKPQDVINKTLKEISLGEDLQKYFEETISQIKQAPNKLNSQISIPVGIGDKISNRIVNIDAIPEFNESELETILFVGHDITEAKRIELEIQDKNRKIEDSIHYAQRIQTSILPSNLIIRESLPKSFIFYKPRDVVSGDFPWFFLKGNEIYIAVVDCTGHGVPGALLSFIGYFLLNNIVDHEREFTSGEILDQLHHGVRTTLKQDRADANARDGMDIAFCKINLKKQELQYAGAHRPLYVLRNGELIEYKGDRKAIGGIALNNKMETNFTNYVIDIKKNDKIFFFSDGMTDQLGGPENKKYSPKRVRDILIENSDFSMVKFNTFFEKDFYQWMGTSKQIDDVLLIGIEF
jgi:PAS domain S-box-containing protein